ncbi:Pyroglutamyl-peptidase 1 [Harpegnathos saltator]|uniref:Pyroglutamyl-peptidase 1 n=2 Tax=Harpegnathos saltator TaxID=610380 RepID=E2BSI9_HARSA|nr:Pyroglutamyl-peptidase 1 [Harpegnathos saltator]
MIVVHVGVSHKAECLTIECRAHNNGYQRIDIHAKYPDETDMECKILETGIDTNELCNNINKNSTKSGYKACISCDAGRYLCEYIFYQSLLINPTKTLFVHVPDFNKYTSAQTAKGLYDILCNLLRNSKYR